MLMPHKNNVRGLQKLSAIQNEKSFPEKPNWLRFMSTRPNGRKAAIVEYKISKKYF